MRSSARQSDFWVTAMLLAVALGLLIAPAAWTDVARATARDATLPGQRLLVAARDWRASAWHQLLDTADERAELETLQAEVEEWQLRYRRLEIESAALHEDLAALKQSGVAPYSGEAGQPLLVPQLLEATVLGEEFPALWTAGHFVDRGAGDGVVETSLVLDDAALKVDHGADSRLESGQAVYAGRAVVGRIARVGRWMSTIRRVTDPDYRGLAQLGRRTPHGMQYGAQGELEGRGDGQPCRLTRIAATEPVRVGDEVYTAGRETLLPLPMYYGTVVKVEHRPGEECWDIEVEPAIGGVELRSVQILRQKLNEARVLAQ
jgi:cell shape-determining protein MreC